jgi:hypothetical protein
MHVLHGMRYGKIDACIIWDLRSYHLRSRRQGEISNSICNYACLMTLNSVFHERQVSVVYRSIRSSSIACAVGRVLIDLARNITKKSDTEIALCL